MAGNKILSWLDGRGWLVLAGGVDSTREIRGLALTRLAADGGLAFIALADDEIAEQALDDLEALGGPSGYLVDILTEDDTTIIEKLSDAGMIVIVDRSDIVALRSALVGAALEGMKIAHEHGAFVLAEGRAAALFGSWLSIDDVREEGLDWLTRSAVVSPSSVVAELPGSLSTLLIEEPESMVVGIGAGSALALGPDGEVEMWGEREVTIRLGSKFTQ